MARTPYVDRNGLKKGTWTRDEDVKLAAYVSRYGCRNWRRLPRDAGLARCGKSCRLRWLNYLRPDIKRGNFTQEEEAAIVSLHEKLGNKWSVIATYMPGRTDNEIKNFWNTHLKRLQPKEEPLESNVSDENDRHVLLGSNFGAGIKNEFSDFDEISSWIENYNEDINHAAIEVSVSPHDLDHYSPDHHMSVGSNSSSNSETEMATTAVASNDELGDLISDYILSQPFSTYEEVDQYDTWWSEVWRTSTNTDQFQYI